jgi:hypothetical protein
MVVVLMGVALVPDMYYYVSLLTWSVLMKRKSEIICLTCSTVLENAIGHAVDVFWLK